MTDKNNTTEFTRGKCEDNCAPDCCDGLAHDHHSVACYTGEHLQDDD